MEYSDSLKKNKRTLNLLIGLVLCIWSCDHYNVQSLTEGSFIQAVALSYQSGDSVAYHTIPNFFTYRYSQTILHVPVMITLYGSCLLWDVWFSGMW